MKYKKEELEEAKKHLRSLLVPGQKIYGEVKHVSRSGMYRVISLKIVKDNELIDISWEAGKLLEGFDERHCGCKASGCGMDMVFHLIYNLGWAVFPEGYQCIGENCLHNSHVNSPKVPKDGKTFHSHESGYCFRQA